MMKNLDEPNVKMDKCVVCGEVTREPLDRHVSFRENYIEGAGQLCNKCSLKF